MLEASALAGVRHGFFTRAGGVSGGLYASLNCGLGSRDARENVLRNRAHVAGSLGVAPERLVNGYQVHSPDVAVVEEPWAPGEAPRVDALVTRHEGIALAAASADCAPLLFADVSAGVVGAAHAGWRGALGGVLEATLEAMEGLGAARGRIAAAIGPTISGAVYEVGPDLVERFAAADPHGAINFRAAERPGHHLFDLPGYIASRLARAGLTVVEDLAVCTYSNEAQHFSYRRATHRGEPDYGRHFSAITLG